MNKRGDIPTALIIPVAFALVFFVIFTFLSLNGTFENSGRDISGAIAESSIYEQNVQVVAIEIFHETINSGSGELKKKYQEISQARDMQIEEEGNFFGKIRTGDFSIQEKDGKYIFEVKGLFVKSEKGYNKMTRVFDIKEEYSPGTKRDN